MADNDTGSDVSEAPDDRDDDVSDGASEHEPEVAAASEDDLGRTELKAMRARKTLGEEAEAARRRVLGTRRGRAGRATLTSPEADDDVDLNERLRQLVRGVEEETDRLQEDVFRLRSAAGRAGATLHEEIQRSADELAGDMVEQLETTVGQTATESLEALAAAINSLQETAEGLKEAAEGLRGSVSQLGDVAPVADQLAQLAAAPPAIPEALAAVISDLTDQLGALGEAVSVQVRTSVEEALAAELGRQEARIEHALARLVDELARLRRRLPVTKRGAAIDLTKEQLTGIGQAVGDYLLAAMREQKG